MSIKKFLTQSFKIGLLLFAFLVIYIGAAVFFIKGLPETPADPGPIPAPFDILIFAAGHVLVLAWIIARSNWRGWKLVLALAFTYYGSITIMSQMETWYFMSNINVGPETLRGLFLAGLPPALVFIPLAVLVLGKWKKAAGTQLASGLPAMPAKQWAWKLTLVAIVYMALYFSAGYYIAWQNPNLVAFYGGVDAGSFWAQMRINLETNPDILQFQFMRGVLWALFALPVIVDVPGSSPGSGLTGGSAVRRDIQYRPFDAKLADAGCQYALLPLDGNDLLQFRFRSDRSLAAAP